MAVLIDIFGAAIIAGILLLTIFGLNANLNQANYNKTFSLITQTNTVTLARIIESDLVKIGYHVSTSAILTAKSDSIKFLADLADDGVIHTIVYAIGPTSLLGTTKNPRDRMLYRVDNGSLIAANVGLTDLSFTYFDNNGDSTSTPDLVNSINVKFHVESSEPVDTAYAAVFWEKRIYPRNLPSNLNN
ncbi:MAG: hypothetical protein HY033_12450 [Ignavibacteriae bacterium]|nr:hypothetical protein [Ignavibacteria bacterium]MBI3365703.1 hypothetical protein [Ignavibacteriota bacterium]